MNNLDFKKLLLGTSLLVGFTAAAPAFAQDAPTVEEMATEVVTTPEADEDDGDEVVVTGSRIKRDTFSSISPLQVITTELSRDVGLIDAAQILQTSEAAAGQQIDSTFAGFVLDNGPGSETVNLRGLGASRTLVLINGRRMAPAGVEGAPSQPSINLLPSTLVERYDLLLDSAASIYGSDAVAGVGNIILRKDFEGLQLDGTVNVAEQGGTDYTLSATYGINADRGFLGAGIEYDYQDPILISDRDFLNGCQTQYEETENGEIRTSSRTRADSYGLLGLSYPEETCSLQGLGRRIRRVPGGLGFVYYTPGQTNTGIPNFSEDTQFSVPIDGDGDGNVDVFYQDYSSNEEFNGATFINEQERISMMAYGEYTLEGDANITPYFELLYSDLETFADGGASQLFTVVPANNPFNPCNPNQPNGVDCGLAADSLLTNPNYLESFRRYYFDGVGATGCFGLPREACTPASFGLLNGALGPQRAGGGVVVQGDRDQVNTSVEQIRLVGGFSGDMPFMNNIGSLEDWTFDVSLVHSSSKGESSRLGIRDDRLHYALGFDPNIRAATGQLVDLPGGACSDVPGGVAPDIAAGCVPVNLFAPSLYDTVVGDFATQAERDYLFDSRDFDTRYKQTTWSAIFGGTVAQAPAGDVKAAVGFEYRVDQIDSRPDAIARDGLFFGFFADQGAQGDKWIREAFAEIDIPLVADKPFFRELDINLAGRVTDEELYGTELTYSGKVGWRPVDSLLLKATYGTSFRAPNLRENFLLGTTGFNNLFDPCVTPEAALGIDGNYNPAQDNRDQITIANCIADGLDPTNFQPVGAGNNVYSAEIREGGSLDLDPETSNSYTLGFSWEQPFTDFLDATIGLTYYNIDVSDTVISPSAQFIINDCYIFQENFTSNFCSRINRSGLDATANAGSFSLIDSGFINQDNEKVSGYDFNADISKDIVMFDRNVDWNLNLRANKLEERSSLFVGDDGSETFEDFTGGFGFPELTGRATLTAEVDKFRFTWQTRFVDSVQIDEEFIDEFSNTTGIDTTGDGQLDTFGQTCSGPEAGDVNCRDVYYADDYFLHTASVRYASDDDWTIIAGMRNVFDKKPPRVDGAAVFSVNNVAIGNGYDYNGRTFFASVRKSF